MIKTTVSYPKYLANVYYRPDYPQILLAHVSMSGLTASLGVSLCRSDLYCVYLWCMKYQSALTVCSLCVHCVFTVSLRHEQDHRKLPLDVNATINTI